MAEVAKNGNKWLHIIAKSGDKWNDQQLYRELKSLFCHFWQHLTKKYYKQAALCSLLSRLDCASVR